MDKYPRANLSAAALHEWNNHVESVARGVAHALNNRAAALSAVAELSKDPADDQPDLGSILHGEFDHVRSLAAAMRTIGPPAGGTEAFAPHDAAVEALAVLKLHPANHDRPVAIVGATAPPIRAARWMFVRSIIALGASAIRDEGPAIPTKIAIVADGDCVLVRVDGREQSLVQLSPYATAMARAMGGEPLGGGCGFRVPTLAALRQREVR